MSEEFKRLVDQRGQALRSKSRLELLELQDCDAERVEIDGRVGTIDIIIEEEPEQGLRVVVQGFLDTKWFSWLGVKDVALDGFRMEPSGNLSELRDEEFYEFD